MVIAAHLAEHIHCIALHRLILRQAVDNNLTLNFHTFIINTAATANGQQRVNTEISAHNRRCRGCIANAHLAGVKQVIALVNANVSHLHASLEASLCLLARHRRSLRKVIRAPRHLLLVHLRQIAQIKRRACVAHEYISLRMTRQHRCTCRTAHIAVNHLARNLLRISTHAILRNTMVAAHQHHRTLQLLGQLAAGHTGELYHHLLQLAQICSRFIHLRKALAYSLHTLHVQCRNFNFFHLLTPRPQT